MIDPNEQFARQLQVRPFFLREAWDHVKTFMPNVAAVEIKVGEMVIARISYSTVDMYIREASKKRG